MNYENFDGMVEEQFEICKTTLGVKQAQYANSADRLDGFKKAAIVQGVTPMQALAGMMAKHTTSVYELIHEGSTNYEMWTEKITDHINYLLFLKALACESCFPNTDFEEETL